MKISDEVYFTLKCEYGYLYTTGDPYTKLFLLGKNKDNVCVALIPLVDDLAGCCFMPSVTSKEIANAMLKLFTKNLEVAGFALVDSLATTPAWGGYRGPDIFTHELPFLFYKDSKLYSQRYERSIGKIITTDVSIVFTKPTT